MKNFSFKRLIQLIKKQWSEDKRMYLLSTLALFGILALVLSFWIFGSSPTYREETVYGLGLLGLFVTGGIFASTSFSSLNNKERGVYALSFPASHAEKLVSILFFNVIVFSIVYVIIFFVLKFGAEAYISARTVAGKDYSYEKINWSDRTGIFIIVFTYAFYAVQSVFILGSITFKKFTFVISAIIIIVIFFSWLLLSNKLIGTILPNKLFSFAVSEIRESIPESYTSYKAYDLPGILKAIAGFTLKFLIAPFFWLVTYFKLKEKQI